MEHTHNPDNRREEQEKLKTKINKTKHKYEIADETIDRTNDDRLKKTLIEKNDRRKEAINSFEKELKTNDDI